MFSPNQLDELAAPLLLRALLGRAVDLPGPGHRVVHVAVLGGDVEVARQHRGRVAVALADVPHEVVADGVGVRLVQQVLDDLQAGKISVGTTT